jgi:hypothetical protein
LQDCVNPFTDLDLEVQSIVCRRVELPEHLVNGKVTGRLARCPPSWDGHVPVLVGHANLGR